MQLNNFSQTLPLMFATSSLHAVDQLSMSLLNFPFLVSRLPQNAKFLQRHGVDQLLYEPTVQYVSHGFL